MKLPVASCQLPVTAAIALALTGFVLGAAAQTQATPPAYMDTPPAIGPSKPYTPPTSQVDQLPNGLRIVVVSDHRFPLISVRMGLRAGATRLTPATAGLASAEADLLTEGTPTRSALQIAQAADAMGGDISASAASDFLYIRASALSSHAPELFQLLSDVVLHPTFPESEVALEKANMLQGLLANRADAAFLANVQFHTLLFGGNPYAITAPTPASIATMDRAALVAFHQKYFLPNNQAEVVVAGDINPARAHNLVQQFFGDWQLGNPTPPPSPPVAPPKQRTIALVERPGSAQSAILLGNLGLTRTSPDYFAFQVANEVLGGSFNRHSLPLPGAAPPPPPVGRRPLAAARSAEWTYGISSSNQPYRDLGVWTVTSQVRTPVTAPAVEEIFKQLDAIRAKPVSAQELSQAKSFLTGNFVLGLQTQGAVANAMLTLGLYGLPKDWLAEYVDNVNSITAEEAQQAAQKIIQPDHALVVVVGDVTQIEAGLAKLAPGPVAVYDAGGRVVNSKR